MPATTYPFEPIALSDERGVWVVRDERDHQIMPGRFSSWAKAYEAAVIHAHMMRLGHPRPQPVSEKERSL